MAVAVNHSKWKRQFLKVPYGPIVNKKKPSTYGSPKAKNWLSGKDFINIQSETIQLTSTTSTRKRKTPTISTSTTETNSSTIPSTSDAANGN